MYVYQVYLIDLMMAFAIYYTPILYDVSRGLASSGKLGDREDTETTIRTGDCFAQIKTYLFDRLEQTLYLVS